MDFLSKCDLTKVICQVCVSLAIYNTKRQEVAVLENGFKHAGKHKVFWNIDEAASGIYYYELKVGNTVQVKKLAALK